MLDMRFESGSPESFELVICSG